MDLIILVVSWMMAGLVVGAVARLLVPGRQAIGLSGTVGLGMAGALLGGLLSWAFVGVPGDEFVTHAWPGWIFAIAGAIVVLLAVELSKRRSKKYQ